MNLALMTCTLVVTLAAPLGATLEVPSTVKVLVHKDAPNIMLEVRGGFTALDPFTGATLFSGSSGKRDLLTLEEFGMKWGEKLPGVKHLRLVSAGEGSSILVDGIQYTGKVEIYTQAGRLNVIIETPIESYLERRLSEEFPSPLPAEVMSAVAITERTETLFEALAQRDRIWQIDAKEKHYDASTFAKVDERVKLALRKTRGALLTFEGKPFKATWTLNSAGQTIDLPSLFRKALTAPPGVVAPLAQKDRDESKWSFALPRGALAKLLELDQITGCDLYVAKGSTKVYGVKLVGGDSQLDLNFFDLQKKIGPELLKSNDFTVQIKGNDLLFTGYGEGAGTGLCLYSAKKMAERGLAADKILSTFFPGAKIEKW